MRISYRGDYALKAVLDLALHYNQGLVRLRELAKRADIPVKFLEQVLIDLKRGGFVESRRGKAGGYLLARAPQEIKLGEVIRLIDGPIEPISCLEKGYKGCRDLYTCVFRKIWEDLARTNLDLLDNITFNELASQAKKNNAKVTYQI